MVVKGILSPTVDMILKTRNPLPVQQQPSPVSPASEIPPYPSQLSCAESESLRNEQIKSKEFALKALADDQEDERGETPLQEVFGKGMIKSTTEPGWRAFKSQRACMGVEAPGQKYLSSGEMQQTSIDGCMHADCSSELRGVFFFKPLSYETPFPSGLPPLLGSASLLALAPVLALFLALS